MVETRYHKTFVIDSEFVGRRLDQTLAVLCEDQSRSLISKWILDEAVTVNGEFAKPNLRLKGGELIEINGEPPKVLDWDTSEDIQFPLIYEDEHIIVVDKPAGLVVHPGSGNPNRTLVNGLLARYSELTKLPRAGIVHRLDKDTSGALVVARSELALRVLSQAISDRSVTREYTAILEGILELPRTVDLPIGRNPRDRTKQQVRDSGRAAQTEIVPLNTYRRHTLIRAKLHTGRTHQIRVHAEAIGYPVLGDRIYGARGILPKHPSQSFIEVISKFPRQALHAHRLVLSHPKTTKRVAFVSAIPEDIQQAIAALEQDMSYTDR